VRPVLWVPLAVFLAIAAFAASKLINPGDSLIPSRLVGQPLPNVPLPPALPGRETIRQADFAAGAPRLINVFASWCVPCIAEAPQMMALARQGVPIDAVAIRDRPADVAAFLQRWGDPYRNVALDADSSLQLAIGSSGVPETFIVDGRGIIRYQHIGAINPSDMGRILQEYEAARAPL
jgi:cytochrome c biogenesis protein CcmG, thiol:disulfide interchange protein DsbE